MCVMCLSNGLIWYYCQQWYPKCDYSVKKLTDTVVIFDWNESLTCLSWYWSYSTDEIQYYIEVFVIYYDEKLFLSVIIHCILFIMMARAVWLGSDIEGWWRVMRGWGYWWLGSHWWAEKPSVMTFLTFSLMASQPMILLMTIISEVLVVCDWPSIPIYIILILFSVSDYSMFYSDDMVFRWTWPASLCPPSQYLFNVWKQQLLNVSASQWPQWNGWRAWWLVFLDTFSLMTDD